MSILIQTGHKSSYSSHLVEKLYERGLEKPLPSYTHKLSYIKVVDTIDKILTANNASVANTKLADNIMVDFLLANLDQENWGWESDKNLTALEYWQQLEPNVKFVMVFDHPKYLFTNLENKEITTDDIDGMMEEWISYHTLMLDILNRYSDKTILIEGACAVNNIANLNEKVESIASTLKLKSSWQIQDTIDTSSHTQLIDDNTSVVFDLIADETLRKYPEAIKVFNSLLDKAVMKCSEYIYKTKRTELTQLVSSFNYLQKENEYYKNKSQRYQKEKEEILLTLVEVEKEKNNSIQDLKIKSQYIESIESEKKIVLSQLAEVKKELHQYLKEKEEILLTLTNVEKERHRNIQDLQVKSQDVESEKKVILSQLTEVKQELQQYQAKKQEYDKIIAELNKKVEEKNNSQNTNASIEIKKENEFLIQQLHKTQEKLEQYIVEDKKKKMKL